MASTPLASATTNTDMKWAFPTMTDPVIVDLSKTGGQTTWNFSATQDVIVIGSDTPRTSQLKIDGGRNVVVLGGEYAPVGDSKSATIQIQNVTKAIHIEGVHIDSKNASQDGIAVSGAGSSQPSVTVQNSVITNIHGTQSGTHADVFQTWGPVGDMRFYNITGDTSYQGFFIAPQYSPGHKSADFENVNISYNGGSGYTYQYWFLDGNNQTPYPVTLKNVYATERAGQSAESASVWPKEGMGAVRVGDQITFQGLPYTGAITVGTPAKNFATTTNTGANFKLDSSDIHIDGSGATVPSTPGTDAGTTPTPTTPTTPTPADSTLPVSGTTTKWINSTDAAAKVMGTSGNDQIAGVEGKTDTGGMAGGKGDDIYIVDKAGDMVTEKAGEGTDTVVSYSSSYTLSANVENLTLAGAKAATGTGNDGANILTANDAGNKLYGGNGADMLVGGKGADVLNGGNGADTMKGGLSGDTYHVNNTGDKVVELSNQGVDTVQSSISYTLPKFAENLVLVGNANINGTGSIGNNLMVGNNGNNALNGAAGDDRLFGAKGNDMMTGGTGKDTFILKNAGAGTDTIKDFSLGNDTLDLHNVVKSVGAANTAKALQDHMIDLVQNGKNTDIVAHSNGADYKVAVVENVDAAALLKTADHWS